MNLAKILISIGIFFILAGIVVWMAQRIPGLNRLGRLPGDFHFEGKGYSFYFPLATSILISLLLSGIFHLLSRSGK